MRWKFCYCQLLMAMKTSFFNRNESFWNCFDVNNSRYFPSYRLLFLKYWQPNFTSSSGFEKPSTEWSGSKWFWFEVGCFVLWEISTSTKRPILCRMHNENALWEHKTFWRQYSLLNCPEIQSYATTNLLNRSLWLFFPENTDRWM